MNLNTIFVIFLFIIVSIIGLVNLILENRKLQEKRHFAQEYLSKFQLLLRSYNTSFDMETYVWLTKRVIKIQSELGSIGIFEYRPPGENITIPNYQIISNTLPELRSRYANPNSVRMCEDVLIRYIGYLDEFAKIYIAQMKNPFKWFKEGVASIISLPVLIFYWTGLIGATTVKKITGSPFFNFISALVTIIGLVSSIMYICLGWDDFISLTKNFQRII